MERKNSALIFWILAIFFLLLVLREPLSRNFGGVEKYDYSQFIEKVKNKEVLKCVIGRGEIIGELKNGTRFTTNFIPEIAGAEMEKILRENEVHFSYKTPMLSEGWQNFIFFILFPLLFLIEGLLSFVVSASETSSSLPSNCVYFVYENKAGGISFCLVKEVPYPCCTYSHEHLHKFRA